MQEMGQFDVLGGDHVTSVMGIQDNLDPVVDIGPVRVVVALFNTIHAVLHEGDRRGEIGKGPGDLDPILIAAPAWEFGQGVLDALETQGIAHGTESNGASEGYSPVWGAGPGQGLG